MSEPITLQAAIDGLREKAESLKEMLAAGDAEPDGWLSMMPADVRQSFEDEAALYAGAVNLLAGALAARNGVKPGDQVYHAAGAYGEVLAEAGLLFEVKWADGSICTAKATNLAVTNRDQNA